MLVGPLQFQAQTRSRVAISGGLLSFATLAGELALIVGLSLLTGIAWHLAIYDGAGDLTAFAGVGALAGLFYTLPFVFRSHYQVERLLAAPRTMAQVMSTWTYAFFCLAALAFLTKTTGFVSRGWLALFYVIGGVGVMVGNGILTQAVRGLVANGVIAPRRLLVIGSHAEIASFTERTCPRVTGVEVVASAELPANDLKADEDAVDDIVDSAIAHARSMRVGEILILADGNDSHAFVSRLVNRFLDLPVAVHVGRLPLADQFPTLRPAQVGGLRTLSVRSAPLTAFELAQKRALDLLGALFGLILLAPIMAVIAVLIRLDSPGPVFFRQRRRGFNLHEFTIWKFRTMTTLDDGERIAQARPNDPRVTRVGAVLRRYNLDELPQFINVLMGEMSLVGPRPHAVAHDRHYERIIKRYPRRLNVKPGITGWAQVNGFRGLTDTDHAMRSRIAHDLYYIDNWSVAFDIYILALTVLSPRAFRNAL